MRLIIWSAPLGGALDLLLAETAAPHITRSWETPGKRKYMRRTIWIFFWRCRTRYRSKAADTAALHIARSWKIPGKRKDMRLIIWSAPLGGALDFLLAETSALHIARSWEIPGERKDMRLIIWIFFWRCRARYKPLLFRA